MEQWEDWKRTLPAIAYSHPAWLVEKWEEQWDTTAATTLCQWNQGAPSIMARWNPIQGSVESLQDQWNQEGIAFKECLHDWSAPHRCSSSRVRRVPQQIRRASSKANITSKIQAPYWRCICSILNPPNPSSTPVLLQEVKPRPCPVCLLYTSPSPRDATLSRMPSSA